MQTSTFQALELSVMVSVIYFIGLCIRAIIKHKKPITGTQVKTYSLGNGRTFISYLRR